MKKIDIENAFMNIYPSQSLKIKITALEKKEKMQSGRKQYHRLPAAIPITIAAAIAVILLVFGGYSLLSRWNINPDVLSNPQNTQSVNAAQTGITTQIVKSTAAFLVKVYAANGTATELSKDSTTLMAYSEPGLPIMLESLDHRAMQYKVNVNQGTIWTGEGTGLKARGISCVLAADDKLYWSAQTADGTYVKSAVISIAAYSGETLLGEIVVTIRRGDGKDYDARVVEGVAQNVNADGSITLQGKVTDKVYVNTVVTGITDLGAKTADICRAQLYPVLKAPYITMFGADRTVTEHKTYNNVLYVNGKPYTIDNYTYTNGDKLIVSGDGAVYRTQNSSKLDAAICSFYPGLGAIDKDWDFASREEAYEQIKSAYSKLGIEISDQYDVYTYDFESLKKIWQDHLAKLIADGNEINLEAGADWSEDADWSAADNCYYFVLRQELNGLPVTKRGNAYFTSETNITFGPTLEVIYTKNGIEMLNIMDPYEVKTVEQSTAVISLEDAMKSFGNFCAQIEGGSIRTITGISYEYVPFAKDNNNKSGYDLVPCWTLQVSGGHMVDWYFINAVTSECYKAEEVLYG